MRCVAQKSYAERETLPCNALGNVNTIKGGGDTHIYYSKLSRSAKRYIDVTNMKQQRCYKTRSSKTP